MPLGASTWCFNSMTPDEVRVVLDGGAAPTSESLSAMRAFFHDLTEVVLGSNIQAIELWFGDVLEDEGVVANLNRLAELGRIYSMHAPFGPLRDLASLDDEVRRRGIEGCNRAASLLNRFRGKTLVIHGSSGVVNASEKPERKGKSAQSIAEIADFCRDLNIEVAVEVLSNLAVGSSASELLELLEMVNRSNVGVCLDVNHVFPPSQLIPFVHAVGKNLLTLHISDYDGEKEKHWLPGMGIIDWKALIRALNDVGYHGPFMYETRFEAVDLRDLASKLEENYNMLMASAGD